MAEKLGPFLPSTAQFSKQSLGSRGSARNEVHGLTLSTSHSGTSVANSFHACSKDSCHSRGERRVFQVFKVVFADRHKVSVPSGSRENRAWGT